MGFQYKQYHKGLYVNGHERADVVEYRNQFLANMAEFVLCLSFIHSGKNS